MINLTYYHKVMLSLLKPILPVMLFGFVAMVGVVGVQLTFPTFIGGLIDEKAFAYTQNELAQTALLLFALAVTYSAMNSLRYYLFDLAGNKVVIALKQKLFNRLIDMEVGFFDGQKTGELSSRLSVDVESIRDLLTTQLAILVRTVATSLGGIAMLFYLSWQLTLLILLAVPVSFLFGRWIGGKLRVTSRNLQQAMADSLDIAQESFINVRQVQAFNRQQSTKQKYATVSDKVLGTSIRQGLLGAIFQGCSNIITYSALILILWTGGQLILSEAMSFGELTSFVMYAGITTYSFTGILGFWTQWLSTQGASERVFNLLERPPKIKREIKQDITKAKIQGAIAFENVSFSYPQRPNESALEDVSFRVAKGHKIAFVGASGAGKSTIASLILGFYEPDNGDILFDGAPYNFYQRSAINDQIALVEQEPNLFSGSIAENIAFGLREGEATDEQIVNAAKQANAHNFITKFENGYETEVGQNGVQLSGGQKQRIAIARAILRDPAILILDEASSALDADSEKQVQEALNHLMEGRTTLIIAHRLSTIINADSIVVMQKGRTVQSGNHMQLLQQHDGVYKQLIAEQLQQHAA